MATHGESKSMKRSQVPKVLRVPRKRYTYISKPLPGPHKKNEAISLLVFIRDVLKEATSAREAKYIIKHKLVKVNGKVVKEEKANVGFSDIIQIENDYYLIWLDEHGKLTYKKVNAPLKYEKVMKIDKGKKGFLVYRMHDGYNLMDKLNAINAKINDTIVRDLNTGKLSIIPFAVGKKAIVFRGNKIGYFGELISVGKESKIKTESGEIINALSSNCLVYE